MFPKVRSIATSLFLLAPLITLGSVFDEELLQPQAISCHPNGHLYVADSGNTRIAVFDRDGRFLKAFGRKGHGPGEFQYPENLAVLSNGDLVVSDIDTRTLHLFDASGTFKRVWKKMPTLVGELLATKDGGLITSGSRGFRFHIRIGEDLDSALLKRFDAQGNLVGELGTYKRHKVPMMTLQQNAGPLTLLGDVIVHASRITNDLRIFRDGKEDLTHYPTAFVPKEPFADMTQSKDKDGKVSIQMKVDLDLLCFGLAGLDDSRMLMLRATEPMGDDDLVHSQLIVINVKGDLLQQYPTAFHARAMALSTNKRTAYLIDEDEEGWSIVSQTL